MPLHKKITLSDYLLKKYCKPISRILYPVWQREVIIYLAVTLLQQSCCLPFPIPIKTGSKRAAYLAHKRKPGYTWHYSTQGLPTIVITYNHRELLPHVFTLIHTVLRGRLFSVALSSRRKPGPAINRCVALRWPDFPPPN